MMKAVFAAALILGGMTATGMAKDPYRIGFLGDINGRRLGTNLHSHHNDYHHYNDLYQRNGYTASSRSDCHRHVSRAAGMHYHTNTQCHRHDPWLHPSLDYGQR